jgi:hypothetical protein
MCATSERWETWSAADTCSFCHLVVEGPAGVGVDSADVSHKHAARSCGGKSAVCACVPIVSMQAVIYVLCVVGCSKGSSRVMPPIGGIVIVRLRQSAAGGQHYMYWQLAEDCLTVAQRIASTPAFQRSALIYPEPGGEVQGLELLLAICTELLGSPRAQQSRCCVFLRFRGS